jgi:hypothetical protein
MSHVKLLLCLAAAVLQTFAQDTSGSQTECKFLDGKAISIALPDDSGRFARMTTNERLVTVKGINIPSGDYTISPVESPSKKWTLAIKSDAGNRDLPPVPMSSRVTTSTAQRFNVAVKRTGASCTMTWTLKETNVILSAEFGERNTDLPLLPSDLAGRPIK